MPRAFSGLGHHHFPPRNDPPNCGILAHPPGEPADLKQGSRKPSGKTAAEGFDLSAEHGTYIRAAVDSTMADFEDAVPEAAAREGRASFIITRNAADFTKSQVPTLEPETFLRLLDNV